MNQKEKLKGQVKKRQEEATKKALIDQMRLSHLDMIIEEYINLKPIHNDLHKQRQKAQSTSQSATPGKLAETTENSAAKTKEQDETTVAKQVAKAQVNSTNVLRKKLIQDQEDQF